MVSLRRKQKSVKNKNPENKNKQKFLEKKDRARKVPRVIDTFSLAYLIA